MRVVFALRQHVESERVPQGAEESYLAVFPVKIHCTIVARIDSSAPCESTGCRTGNDFFDVDLRENTTEQCRTGSKDSLLMRLLNNAEKVKDIVTLPHALGPTIFLPCMNAS